MSGEDGVDHEESPSRTGVDDSQPSVPTGSLGSRAISGSLWTVGRFSAENVLRLGSNLVLTRLLVPEAFGVMAIVSATLAGLAMFADVGISSSVVQNSREDDDFLNTVWTLQAIRGAVLWFVSFLVSGLLADFYDMPELKPLIVAASFTSFIAGFNSIALLRMRRHLQLRELAMIETAGQLIQAIATIGCALVIRSVWALVIGAIIGFVFRLIISHVATGGYRCRFKWEAEARRELLNFAKWIFVSTILTFLAGQSDRLIFGKLMDVRMLGVFSIALTLAAIPISIVWQIGNLVIFPALSRTKDSPEAFQQIYRQTVQPVLAFGALAIGLLGAGGPEAVEILYDDRYLEAGWMLQILAVAAWMQVPQATTSAVPLAMGQPRWLAAANAMKFLSMLILLPLGFQMMGAVGAMIGLVASEFFRYATFAVGVKRFGIPVFNGDVAYTALAIGSTLAGTYATGWLGEAGYGPFVRAAAAAVTVVTIWAIVTAFLMRTELPRLVAGVREALGGQAASAS